MRLKKLSTQKKVNRVTARKLARKGLDLGFLVSLSGIVTFKNALDLQETAKWLPIDQMLVETDSPFLAPVPHRGRPCEPAYVAETARILAEVRGMTPQALAELTVEAYGDFLTDRSLVSSVINTVLIAVPSTVTGCSIGTSRCG